MKKVKVKNLAEKYDVSPKVILNELLSEGIEVTGPSSVIPPDMYELIIQHLDETVFVKKNKKDGSSDDQQSKIEVHIKTPIIVKNLAEALDKKPNQIISDLMKLGELASINQSLSPETAKKLCDGYNIELMIDHRDKDEHNIHGDKPALEDEDEDKPEDLVERPPVVTFLGHVDHGKTSLQDKIRNTKIADGEAGKITQHIGASQVVFNDKKITFIDTPGHEAFTSMRARGANTTDIAILVVAANDGFMPQTIEALNHVRAAGVPIIVAINKIDLPDANPDKVLLQMQQNELMSEDWGGDVGTVKVSATTGEGLDLLLERILLESELLELKANPKRPAQAVVIESQLEQGFGATANILVQKGTLKIGDIILCDQYYGRVKSMLNEHGERVKKAGPSTPVKLVGLSGAPDAGSQLAVCKKEREAKDEAERRAQAKREKQLTKGSTQSIEDLFSKISQQNQKTLNILIKSDVRGSGEAIEDSLSKLPSDKIKVNVVMNAVGAITENDIMLAAASDAILVGFHVQVNNGVNEVAKRQGVEIRLYSIIYELLEDIINALTGQLDPEKREKNMGSARILQIFEVRKGPKVIGCMVEKGSVKVGYKAKVFRKNELIYNGEVISLRRFQDDVKEVKAGLECGIKLDNFADFEENDIVELFEIELKKATL
ncbi:translation initiation factor IF-2 [Lentisphaerota bacterium ZTH]|nr:translation initiation factor IF-2 [Lentisphaerota bacterium]WET07631.1 translation initiation factor IF-2 [Lentisphaerota bacterium ZTH]